MAFTVSVKGRRGWGNVTVKVSEKGGEVGVDLTVTDSVNRMRVFGLGDDVQG